MFRVHSSTVMGHSTTTVLPGHSVNTFGTQWTREVSISFGDVFRKTNRGHDANRFD